MRSRASIERKVTAGFIGAFLLLMVGGGITYQAGTRSAASAARVQHIQEVRTRLGQLYASISDAELAARAHRVTGMPGHREAFVIFAYESGEQARALDALLADNPSQQAMMARLTVAAAARLAALDQAMESRSLPDPATNLAAGVTTDAVRTMGHLRALTREMDASEAVLLLQSAAKAEQQRSNALVFLLLTLLGAASAFFLLSRNIRRQMLARADADEAILRINVELEHRVSERTASLEENQRRLADMFEFGHDALLLVDAAGKVLQVNRQAEALFGWLRSELVGLQVEVLIPQEARGGHPRLRRAFVESSPTRAMGLAASPLCGIRRDGSSFPVEISLSAVGQGEEFAVLVAARDATERKRAEQEILAINADLERRVVGRTAELVRAREAAEAANRAKSAFLATMSHEIRTPMNGVIGMVEVLFHSPMPEDQADAVRTIRASAFALLGIIDDILDFSKIEAGRLELERSALALPELVESVCDTLLPMAIDKHVELSLFISPQVPAQVWSDPTRLRQVLFNLAGNAIKFSVGTPQRPGRVAIRVQMDAGKPGGLVMTFADDGIGMAPETLAQLFSPFTQGEASTTRRFGGTGLGLTICKRLVTLMCGRVEVQSVLGRGSLFTVTLPIEAVEGGAEPGDTRLAGVHCVVVGSEESAADVRAHLEHAGASVHVEPDLAGALKLAGTLLRPVLIHGTRRDKVTPELIRTAFASKPDIRHLLLARGRRRSARIASADVVTLDANYLRRAALLRAVAVAAGRQSPEVLHEAGAEHTARERAEPLTIADARARGRLLLIAEDDEVNQKVILRQIEILGYAAEIADNGAEALRLWSVGEYALLLTDLHMPDMDGYTLAEAIRKQEVDAETAGQPRRHMPILALTANALRGEALRTRDAGMDEYLTKPMQLHLLKAALAKWLPCESGSTGPTELQDESGLVSTPGAIDVSVLKRLIGEEAELVQEFLLAYQASARALAVELRAADAASDIRQIGAIAHKLKSSSRSVGAVALGDLCAELENACRAGAKDGITQSLAQFEAELLAVDAYVSAP